jgi:hypothetical protein
MFAGAIVHVHVTVELGVEEEKGEKGRNGGAQEGEGAARV